MPPVVTLGTPLAEALSNVVQPKLVEMGWSADGGEDSALTEYVILMLVNGKTQEQIAYELSNDLLNLGEGDTQALDFSRWLFEQVEILDKQINGASSTSEQPPSTQAIPSFNDQGNAPSQQNQQDAEMGEASGQGDSVPTGPRAMRNGRQGGRGRLLGQINKNMERSGDSMLHRVRAQPGLGRINSHARDFHKGPRGPHGRMGQGRQMGGMGHGMQGGQMQGSPAGNIMQMSPENQMQLMALLEEQARMMAQLMPGFMPPAVNPNFQQGAQGQQGKSLFERVEQPQRNKGGDFAARAAQNGISVKKPDEQTAPDGEMDTTADQTQKDGEKGEVNTDTVCRYNLRCTKKDCPYAHQSPAAPEGILVDVTDTCPFGPACKNKKCTGRHPSPALKQAHQAEEVCRFFPHCANPHCPFKHPSMPLCRNGADCNVPGCKFTHLTTPCKFHPCLNRNCPYKHKEGQKGNFADKVWVADDKKEKTHVSERKFVADENAEEELIKPGAAPEGSQGQELIT
ncbi:hypothetical protein VTN96DRAFT_9344 [Rasamsonia emersonii]